MEEINLKELYDYFKERLVLILTIVLVVVVLGSAYSIFFKTPLYQSTSKVLLGSSNGTYTTNDVTLNANLVKTYSEVAKSDLVVSQVINQTGVDRSTSSIASNITLAAVSESLMIQISVAAKDPETAKKITDSLVEVFIKEAKDKMKQQNFTIIDEATTPSKPYNVNLTKDVVIYLLVGVVVALATVFVIFYFDTTVKSSDDVEEKFGLPILGVVPKVKR